MKTDTVLILAGGLGTRMSEYTQTIPKPLVEIHGRPILSHIIEIYSSQNVSNFVIAAGYKSEKIKQFFFNELNLSGTIEFDYKRRCLSRLDKIENSPIKVTVVETGPETLTGERVLKCKEYLPETFYLTYGDGLANLSLRNLDKFHANCGSILTISAVRPPARFGVIKACDDGLVTAFTEKNQIDEGWINGGFMKTDSRLFEYLQSGEMLEQEPFGRLVAEKKLGLHYHHGFWRCVDSKRDIDILNQTTSISALPWLD